MSRRGPRWDPDWMCPLCNVVIFGRHDACKKCKTPKLKLGDWVCRRAPCIGELNFATRTSCRQCQQPKPTVCVCSDPNFASIHTNGNYWEMGYCHRCLCPNPTPWYIAILDMEEAKLRQSGVPSEHWCYLVEATGRYQTHNIKGLARLKPMHANAWIFNTRDDLITELSVHDNTNIPNVYVKDGRGK
jgi:hypothetical protein